jgi:trigger factor
VGVKVSSEETGPTSRKIWAEVESEEWKALEEGVLKKLQGSVSLPGFRRGKVPFDVLRKRYGGAVGEETVREFCKRVLKQMEEEGQRVVSVDQHTFDSRPGAGGLLTLWVEVLADFPVPNYRSILLEPFEDFVRPEEIDTAIERLRKQGASYKEVEREVCKGDYVKVSYRGTVDGTEIDTLPDVPKIWGIQKMTWEEADSLEHPCVPAIVTGILGMRKGESREVEMNFPAEFHIPQLAGQRAVYRVEVHDIREPQLPALDENFCRAQKVQNVEELRAAISKNLDERKRWAHRDRQRQIISDFLVRNVDCPLPKILLQSETEQVLQEMVNVFAGRGVNERELQNRKEALVEKAQTFACERLKMRFCLQKIADQENIRLEEKDLRQALVQEAVRQNLPVEEVVKELKRNSAERERFRRTAFQSKVLHFLHKELEEKADRGVSSGAV